MKRLEKAKPIFIACIALLLSITSVVSFFLYQISSETKKVIIRNESGENVINKITIGETAWNLKSFSEDFDIQLEDQDDDDGSNDELILKNHDTIEFETSILHNIYVSFAKDDSDGNVFVQVDRVQQQYHFDDTKESDFYFHSSSVSHLVLEHCEALTSVQKGCTFAVILILTFVFYILIKKILNLIDQINQKKHISVLQIIMLFFLYAVCTFVCMLPVIEILHKWYFVIVVIQLAYLLYKLRSLLRQHLHILFALFAIILCTNMAILLPPFHVPDEFSHYIKAASIFDQEHITVKKDGRALYAISEKDYRTEKKYTIALHDPNYRTSFKEYYVDMTLKGSDKQTENVGFTNTYSINSFAYIPSAIVIKLASFVDCPITLSALLGRLINSLIFILCGYFSLKLIPKFKKLYFLLLLFPVTIQQVSGICQDSLTLSIIFLLVSLILHQAYGKDKKVSNKHLIGIFALSIFLGMCKPGYFLFPLLMWLIPNEKFSSKKTAIFLKSFPFILCIALTLVKYLSPSTTIGSTLENGMTISYALGHPLEMIKMCVVTVYQRLSLDMLTGQINLFGWSTVLYDYSVSFIVYFVYTLCVFFDNQEKEKLKLYDRILMLGIALVTIGIIYASALFSFNMTMIGSQIVAGLQSRYFIPVTILLAFALSNNLIKINVKKKEMLYAIVVIVTFGISFFTIINGFYL